MANYDWREYRERRWADRFPEGVRGLAPWRQQPHLEGPSARLMEERQKTTARLSRPCVFVSHRQADVTPAVRIAYLACQEGFDYWLDVLDPTLSALPGTIGSSSPTPQQSAAAVAGIIEMALLNSTHVVAVMTPNTRGSQWVPYEYGRIKDPVPITLQAACWVDGAFTAPLPEYLYLGAITRAELEIRQWLKTELRRYRSLGQPGGCNWKGSIPPPL